MNEIKKNHTLSLNFVLILCALFFVNFSAYSLTASEIFDKGKAKISGAKSLTASFTMTVSGQTISGNIISKGSKFALTSNAASSWYNGTDLYTYNASTGETTVMNPTKSELVDSNPLLYLTSASNYDVKASKTKKKGVETVVLVPKKSKTTSAKSITLELDSKTYLPVAISVVPQSGGVIKLSISNLKINGTVADTSFEYPKSKYPKAKINDLR